MYKNIYKTIGNTALVKLNKITKDKNFDIFVKLEFTNPSSSIKDRAALYMIEMAEKEGSLKKGDTIVEPTSGNTGIALAMIGAAKGYKVVLVMPESMSLERRKLIKAYGAEIVLTEASLGMEGSVREAVKLSKEPGYFMPNQFENPHNVLAHYETTGKEIIEDIGDRMDSFVAGVGTGGSLSGIGKRLKEFNNSIEIVAVEPLDSPVLAGGKAAAHKIQGIGANFIPKTYNNKIVDKILGISNEEAYKYAKALAGQEGILAGISSGANVAAAYKLGELGRKNIVTVLPDTGERYLSTDLYNGK